MDTGDGLKLLGSAIVSAKTIEKILGPTADYLGTGLKHWTAKRVENAARVFAVAERKLGTKLDKKGVVPANVLKSVFDDASFRDDYIAVEYFGGVLASSRSEVSRDDRGATHMALLARMSTYQIRAHYVLYSLIKGHFDGNDVNLGVVEGRRQLELFVPLESFSRAMDFQPGEKVWVILNHIFFGLSKEDLVGDGFAYGLHDQIKFYYTDASSDGLVVQPTSLGVELYLWAFGKGNLHINDFLLATQKFPLDSRVELDQNGVPTKRFVDNRI